MQTRQLAAIVCMVLSVTVSARAQPAPPIPTFQPGLKPENLLLVVNGNSPVSVRLAEFYTRARFIPDGRIVRLDLPAGEEIPFDTYERNVVPVIRKFLRDNKLENQVRCLVLFHGTPIRVAAIQPTPDEQRESGEINAELANTVGQIQAEVVAFEKYVAVEVPTFSPPAPLAPPGAGAATNILLDSAILRLERAGQAITPKVNRAAPAERAAILARVRATQAILIGDNGLLKVFAPIELADPRTTLEARDNWRQRADKVSAASTLIRSASDRRFDPADRARARDATRAHFGLITLARLLQGQLEYFGTAESHASVDSELAMLWHDWYPRAKWQVNPLYYKVVGYNGPPVLMTARIDGPDEQSPTELILGSLKAERDGLTGRVVIDSRGLRANPTQPSQNAYSDFDQTLRNLAELLRAKTKLTVVFDERDPVLPPNSARDVALYAGWYSVGNYVPCCRFRVGAVGYHTASWEMTSLRDPNNKGWVRSLLKDGVVATTGSVAEPYLFAFPQPDHFFPLLLTGQLTLAEVYWRTQQTVSWQMSLVGDPLYKPFAKNPQLSPDDLPHPLRAALGTPPTTPAPLTSPATRPVP